LRSRQIGTRATGPANAIGATSRIEFGPRSFVHHFSNLHLILISTEPSLVRGRRAELPGEINCEANTDPGLAKVPGPSDSPSALLEKVRETLSILFSPSRTIG
jgi:hypothetical protein